MPKRNRVSRTFKDTPAENRKYDEWSSKLEAEGFRQTGMVALPLRKGGDPSLTHALEVHLRAQG